MEPPYTFSSHHHSFWHQTPQNKIIPLLLKWGGGGPLSEIDIRFVNFMRFAKSVLRFVYPFGVFINRFCETETLNFTFHEPDNFTKTDAGRLNLHDSFGNFFLTLKNAIKTLLSHYRTRETSDAICTDHKY